MSIPIETLVEELRAGLEGVTWAYFAACRARDAHQARATAAEATIETLRVALTAIRDYPNGNRTTEDGYPLEVVYDEWAYRRMVDSYREAATVGLARALSSQGGGNG